MHGYKSQRVEWSKTWNMSGTLTWVKIERWQKGGANILQKKSLKDYHSHTSFRRPSNSQRLKWGAVQESLESMCQKSEILRTCSKDQREERPKFREIESRAMQDQPPRSRGTHQSIYIQVWVVVFSHPIRVAPLQKIGHVMFFYDPSAKQQISGGLSILVWAFPLASQDQTRHENAKSIHELCYAGDSAIDATI